MSTANCFSPACLGSSHTSAFISGHTEQAILAKPVGNSQSHVCPAHSPCFSTIPSTLAYLEINSFFLYFTQETCTGLSFKLLMLTTSNAYKDSKLILVLKRCLSVFKATQPCRARDSCLFLSSASAIHSCCSTNFVHLE